MSIPKCHEIGMGQWEKSGKGEKHSRDYLFKKE
jgi:hypothetical protein